MKSPLESDSALIYTDETNATSITFSYLFKIKTIIIKIKTKMPNDHANLNSLQDTETEKHHPMITTYSFLLTF